jgi:TPR repeat protein
LGAIDGAPHADVWTRGPRTQPFPPQHAPWQGHIKAALSVGSTYYWGQGVAVDYPRAMAAYKVGAEGGDAACQYQVGHMYYFGHGVDVDYEQALPWFQKAAAQDHPNAVSQLGAMYGNGQGVTPSWRRAREHYERAIGLRHPKAVENMQTLTGSIQAVTNERSHHSAASLTPPPPTPLPPIPLPATYRPPPSWTSGWRSTARAGQT